jgi:hypothetical protein
MKRQLIKKHVMKFDQKVQLFKNFACGRQFSLARLQFAPFDFTSISIFRIAKIASRTPQLLKIFRGSAPAPLDYC